jgi:hypothetical protein
MADSLAPEKLVLQIFLLARFLAISTSPPTAWE